MSSPYRDAPQEEPREDEGRPLFAVDVHGADGAPGRRGEDGAPGSGHGASGRPGANAGPAQPGQRGGRVRLELTRGGEGLAPGSFAAIEVSGLAITASGQEQRLRATVPIEARLAHASFEVAAYGGDGGDGGHGGNGGDGARGRDGSDATRFSSGGNGGDGGDGGNGGNGSRGAPGGDGGELTVVVSERDTALLMLLAHDLGGGDGGAPGRNGDGGTGGKGGDGGDSYSWSETESYTDSSGNRQTRSVSHRNSGGSDGSAGRAGIPGYADVSGGPAGAAGRLTIEVLTAGAIVTYDAPYAPRLAGFRHADASDDGIYEPGERGRVFAVEVENQGGMPTPSADELAVALQLGDWILPAPEHLVAPPAIPAGRREQVPGELPFRLRDHVPTEPGEPLCVRETLAHRAFVAAVQRDVPGYAEGPARALGELVIQFPAHLAKVEALRALAPGETSRVIATVHNRSTQALGAGSPGQRALRVRFATAASSELGDEAFALGSGGRSHAPSAGVALEVEHLPAGASAEVELTVSALDGAPAYRSFTGHVTLELGALDQPAAPRPIHLRDFNVRVARRFVADGADLLLVVNHRTSHEVLAAWEDLARRLATNVAVWDLSREQHLDLELPVYEGASLAQRFAGKAMVILNNPIEGPLGPCYPDAWLPADQAVRAAARGLDLAFVGKDARLQHLLLAGAAVGGGSLVPVQDEAQALAAAPDGARVQLPCYQTFRLRFWARPRAEWLTRQAHRLSERLHRAAPERRHLVVTRFAPEIESSSWWWGTRWRVGTLETTPLLDSVGQAMVQAEVEEARLGDAAYVRDAATTAAVLAMFDFGEQLEQLRRGLVDPEADQALLAQQADAVLVDLLDEWLAARVQQDTPASAQPLPRLARLVQPDGGLPRVELGSSGGDQVLGLLSRLRFASESQALWWQRLPPWRWLGQPARCLSLLRQRCQQALLQAFGEEQLQAARAQLTTAVKELARLHRAQRKAGAGRRRPWALAMARAPLLLPGVQGDGALLQSPQERVLAEHQFDALTADEAVAAARRQELRDAARALHQRLFVPG